MERDAYSLLHRSHWYLSGLFLPPLPSIFLLIPVLTPSHCILYVVYLSYLEPKQKRQDEVSQAPTWPEMLVSFNQFLSEHGLLNPQSKTKFVFASDGPFDVRDFVVKQCYISKVRSCSLRALPSLPPSSRFFFLVIFPSVPLRLFRAVVRLALYPPGIASSIRNNGRSGVKTNSTTQS